MIYQLTETLKNAATKYDIETAIYGDIDIQSHRDWEDKVSTAAGMEQCHRLLIFFLLFSLYAYWINYNVNQM